MLHPGERRLEATRVSGAKCIRAADLSLVAILRSVAAVASTNVHGRNDLSLSISGVVAAVKCPRSSPCFIRIWTESTMVGVGTRTMTVTAICAGGGAGLFISTTTDSTAPLPATRGTYPSSLSTPTRESDDGADTFMLHLEGEADGGTQWPWRRPT